MKKINMLLLVLLVMLAIMGSGCDLFLMEPTEYVVCNMTDYDMTVFVKTTDGTTVEQYSLAKKTSTRIPYNAAHVIAEVPTEPLAKNLYTKLEGAPPEYYVYLNNNEPTITSDIAYYRFVNLLDEALTVEITGGGIKNSPIFIGSLNYGIAKFDLDKGTFSVEYKIADRAKSIEWVPTNMTAVKIVRLKK